MCIRDRYIGAESQLIDFTVALDKLSKVGIDRVVNELESKDFSADAIQRLKPFLSLEGDFETQLGVVSKSLKYIKIAQQGIDELRFIYGELNKQNLKSVSLTFDITLARGLNYYTGLILEVMPPQGIKMGSLGGGGRYDNLTDLFGLKNTSGFGISFGFDRIFLVLEELNLFPNTLNNNTKVLFLNFGEESASFCFDKITKLRDQDFPCELYPTPAKLKKQMNYANQRSIPYVVMLGSDELQKEIFVIKNMSTGIQSEHAILQISKGLLKLD